jgi:hypothetical protein
MTGLEPSVVAIEVEEMLRATEVLPKTVLDIKTAPSET